MLKTNAEFEAARQVLVQVGEEIRPEGKHYLGDSRQKEFDLAIAIERKLHEARLLLHDLENEVINETR